MPEVIEVGPVHSFLARQGLELMGFSDDGLDLHYQQGQPGILIPLRVVDGLVDKEALIWAVESNGGDRAVLDAFLEEQGLNPTSLTEAS